MNRCKNHTLPPTPYVDFLTGFSPGSYDAFISHNQPSSIM